MHIGLMFITTSCRPNMYVYPTERDILSLGTRFPPWSVEKTLQMMDKTGVNTAMVSISGLAANIGDAKAVCALACATRSLRK